MTTIPASDDDRHARWEEQERAASAATRDIADVPAVEVITTAAVHLMSAAAVKVGLADDPATQTDLDESPALAPNGRMVMYATKQGGRGVLASVSVYGGVQVLLPSQRGETREPAWGPLKPR